MEDIGVTDTAVRKATCADLEAVPPHLVAEIIDGVLDTHLRPAPWHAIAATRLNAVIRPPFELGSGGRGGWIFIGEPEPHRGPHVVAPDLAGWRSERMPNLPKPPFDAIAFSLGLPWPLDLEPEPT